MMDQYFLHIKTIAPQKELLVTAMSWIKLKYMEEMAKEPELFPDLYNPAVSQLFSIQRQS